MYAEGNTVRPFILSGFLYVLIATKILGRQVQPFFILERDSQLGEICFLGTTSLGTSHTLIWLQVKHTLLDKETLIWCRVINKTI